MYFKSKITSFLFKKNDKMRLKLLQNSRRTLFESILGSSQKSWPEAERRIFQHDIVVDGQTIHYQTGGWGPINVLLMPGSLGTAVTDFSVQFKEMSFNKYSLIAWDPPGHGRSRPPEKDFNDFYAKHAQIAANFMKLIGLQNYCVLGWSDGGITAMILAAKYGRENVEKLVIWGANAYFADSDHQAVNRIRDISKTWSKTALSKYEPVYGIKDLQKLWEGSVDYYIKTKDVCTNDLANIIAPTLILHGDKDSLVAPEHSEHLRKNIPNATLHRFEHGRHDIHSYRKSFKEFNSTVDEFLSGKH